MPIAGSCEPLAALSLRARRRARSARPRRPLRRDASARPQLVVFLTVDQMRPDYLDRWAPQLTGGLGRLSQRGRVLHERLPGSRHHRDRAGSLGDDVGAVPAIDRNRAQHRRCGGSAGAAAHVARSGCLAVPIPRLRADRLDAHRGSALARAVDLAKGSRRDPAAWVARSRACSGTRRRTASSRRVATTPTRCRLDPARERAARSAATGRAGVDAAAARARVRGAGQRAAGERRARLHLSARAPERHRARGVRSCPSTPMMDQLTLDAALEGAAGARPRPGSTDGPAGHLAVGDRLRGSSLRSRLARAARQHPAPRPRARRLHRLAVQAPRLDDDRLRAHGRSRRHVVSRADRAARRTGRRRRATTSRSRSRTLRATCSQRAGVDTDGGRLRRCARARGSRRRSRARASIPIRCSRGSPTRCAGSRASRAWTACATWRARHGARCREPALAAHAPARRPPSSTS